MRQPTIHQMRKKKIIEERSRKSKGYNICFICECSLNEGAIVTVNERGLNTFKESSKRRGDGKNKRYLKNLTSIVVHDPCRKNYINENLIWASNRRRSDVPISPAPTSSLRSLVPSFNFNDYCFLCNVKIDEEYLLKQKKTKLCDCEFFQFRNYL
jgi:hypothetical protein